MKSIITSLSILCSVLHFTPMQAQVHTHSTIQTFETQIARSEDDAEEKEDGSYITATSSDLELVYDSWNNQGMQTIGLRFDEILIPANATIHNAYIQFTADGNNSGEMTLTFEGENSATPSSFAHGSSQGNSISTRPRTTNQVVWSDIPNWSNNQSGNAQKSPNLSAIVSEIITSNNWATGNPIAFIITGTGGPNNKRKAFAYDGNALKAAKLVIEYSTNSTIDLSISSILTPNSSYAYSNANQELSIEIKNNATQAADNYTIKCYLDGTLLHSNQNTASIPANSSIAYTFPQTIDLSNLGTHTLSFEVEIANDENIADNSKAVTLEVVEEVTSLFFDANSSWKYYDSTISPGNNWHNISFNDSNWNIGAGKMGFGNGNENITLEPGSRRYCFRKKVFIDDVNNLDKVFFHLMHDDGAVIFINGQEVMRTELMPQSGTIFHSTTARQRINNSLSNEFITYTIDKSHFVNGENTIGISVHNVSANDSDLSFMCFVTPTYTYSQDGPYIFYENGEVVVQEITPNGLVTNTYNSVEGMNFTCHFPTWEDKSFSFTVKPNLPMEPSVFPTTPTKFLVISDFDNHIQALSMVLIGEGIMDENFNWTYGNGHLIVSGDLFDRGVNVTECLWLLYKLETEAAAQGGKVHMVIGNHEIMNMTDDWRYIEGKYFTNSQLMNRNMIELYGENSEIGRWLRTKNIIIKLGDYAIMHGGISPQVANIFTSYEQLNEYGRNRMNGVDCTGDCFTATGSNGIYWYRGMANEELSQQQVDDILDVFDVKRVIFGHTKGTTIRSLYNGKVLAIDMYHMTNFANGYMEALKFELGCFYLFHTTNTTTEYTQIGDCDVSLDNKNIEKIDLNIYPNPTSQFINIDLPQMMMGINKFQIIDTTGKQILSGEISQFNNRINVSSLPKGAYFLIIQGEKHSIKGKFIAN